MKTIGFRPTENLGTRIESLIETLEVRPTDLVRRAVELGIEKAAEEIRVEKMRKAQTTVSKLSALALYALKYTNSVLRQEEAI